jgi:L-alanine-DL-glutamate epimerase-like enolase superfamily enzyme
MKVIGVDAIPVSVPRKPDVNIVGSELGAIPSAEFVIVRVRTDEGVDGWGEAPVELPWTGEDVVIAKHCIDTYLAPIVIGLSPFDVNRALGSMESAIPWHPYSKAAIEMALWDIIGKAVEQPVCNLLGGRLRNRIGVKFVCAGPDARSTVELARRTVERGFRTIKLKTGFDVAGDVEKVRKVRAAVGDEVRISIDSNEGWSVPEAVAALRQMDEVNLLFAEQPVPAANPRWMRDVRRRVTIPIAAHESVRTLVGTGVGVDYEIADIWAITPSTHGGLVPAKKIMAVAESHGIGCLIGSTLELGVATAALLHLSASTPSLDGERYPSDIIGPLYHQDDIIEETFAFRDGYVEVPEGPGLGVTVSQEKLARYRRD